MEQASPTIAIADGNAAELNHAVERVRLFDSPGVFWGAEIDLRHPAASPSAWYAESLFVTHERGVTMVTWASSPVMGMVALRHGDRLTTAEAEPDNVESATDAPADQDRLKIKLRVVKAGGRQEDLDAPLIARNALGERWGWANHRMGELLWLDHRLKDLTGRKPPRKGAALAAFAVALDEAQTALAAAGKASAETEEACRPLHQWILSGGELSPDDVADLLWRPRDAAMAAARAGYAVAHVEALAGYRRSVSTANGRAGKARHRTTDEAKAELRRIWASGKYGTRDLCAEEEYQALGISHSTARRALRNAPNPAG